MRRPFLNDPRSVCAGRRGLILGAAAMAAAASLPGGASGQPAALDLARRGSGQLAAIPGVYNFRRGNNAGLLRALRATKGGAGDTVIACMGDSITAGKGSVVAANGYDGAHDASYPARLAAAMTAAGIPNTYANWFGQGTSSTTDADVVAYFGNLARSGSGFALSPTVVSLAGFVNAQNGNSVTDYVSTTTYTCPAGVQADRVKVWYLTAGTAGVLELAVDGTPQTLINCNAATSLATVTYSMTRGTGHTLRARKDSTSAGAGVYVVGVEFWDSTVPSVRLWNWGRGGWLTDDWLTTTQPYNPGSCAHLQGQALTIIELWGNDAISRPSSVSTTVANLNTLISNALGQGQTVWVVSIQPCDPAGSITTAASSLYRPAVMNVALSRNVTFIDETQYHPGWTSWNGAGFAWDANHPSANGYQAKVDRFYGPMFRALWAAA